MQEKTKMKNTKNLIIILATCSISFITNLSLLAQSSSSKSSKSSDDHVILVPAGGSENVGIGTNNPSEKLEIVGHAKINGTLYADTILTDSIHSRIIRVGSGSLILGGVTQTGTNDISTTAGTGALSLQGASMQGTYINPIGGNVGIGTTTPQTLLSLKKCPSCFPVGIAQAYGNVGGATGAMILTTDDGNTLQTPRIVMRGNTTDANILILKGSFQAPETMMFLDAQQGGNVGIGNIFGDYSANLEPPTCKLDIDGDLRIRDVAEDQIGTFEHVLVNDQVNSSNIGKVYYRPLGPDIWDGDDDTQYSAGAGLTLTGTTFSHTAHTGDATGITSLTVKGIQGRPISTAIPQTNQALIWDGSQWEPSYVNDFWRSVSLGLPGDETDNIQREGHVSIGSSALGSNSVLQLTSTSSTDGQERILKAQSGLGGNTRNILEVLNSGTIIAGHGDLPVTAQAGGSGGPTIQIKAKNHFGKTDSTANTIEARTDAGTFFALNNFAKMSLGSVATGSTGRLSVNQSIGNAVASFSGNDPNRVVVALFNQDARGGNGNQIHIEAMSGDNIHGVLANGLRIAFSGFHNYPILSASGGAAGMPVPNVGIVNDNPQCRLDVAGDICSNGNTIISDSRFKKNIKPLEGALEIVQKMNGVSYDMAREAFPERNFDAGREIGFLAQDMEKALPEVVQTFDNGYKAIAYSKIVAVLVEGIKEQQVMIGDLTSTIEDLDAEKTQQEREIENIKINYKTQQKQILDQQALIIQMNKKLEDINKAVGIIGNCCSNNQQYDTINSTVEDEFKDSSGNELLQNQPNPFMESTIISYKIVKDGAVDLTVYGMDGKEVVNLVSAYQQSGEYAKTWITSNLPAGIYVYVLKLEGVELIRKAIHIE